MVSRKARTLATAWREHRPYVVGSAALFAAGVVLGLLLAGQVDLFEAVGVDSLRSVFPERVTAVTILLNNTRVFAVFLLGPLTLGVLPLLGLLVNGVLVGYVGALAAGERGLAYVAVALLPHGVLELPALFVASGVAFRILVRAGARAAGRRSEVLTRAEWRRTAALVAAAWVALALAAVVEFYLTARLIALL